VSMVIVDKGECMKNLGDIEAYMLNGSTGSIELYKNPHEKVVVDTFLYRVFIVEFGVMVACVQDGVIRMIHAK